MTESPASQGGPARAKRRRPGWAVLLFAVTIAVAYSPSVLSVFSILADYEALALRNDRFFFHNEAEHLLSIARPIPALLSNWPIPLVQSPQDFRWIHLISLLTVCVLGGQMIEICIVRLHTRVWDAVAVALATFLGLAFIYPVLEATAWVPHLFTTFLGFWAYAVLSRSNVRALAFPGDVARRNYGALARQLPAYLRARPVWISCLIYQCAFYSYPPFALLVVAFPVITVLFSQAPIAYRRLIAVRDVLFVAANLAFFFLSSKLIYLPLVRLFTAKGSGSAGAYEDEYVASLYAGHQFVYNTDVLAMARRFGHLMRVSGDLWFLPQANMYIVTAAVCLLALLAAWSTTTAAPAKGRRAAGNVHSGTATVLVLIVCFVMAALPIVASAGGFVAYRTSVAATAVMAITFVFSIRAVAEWLGARLGRSPYSAARAGRVAMAFAVGAAFAANAYANYSVTRLGRNEFAYFTHIVRQAMDNKSKAIVLIDPRPWSGAQGYNNWPIVDERGRAVPPFELGCFSSFCMQTGAIVRVIAAELGLPARDFELVLTRGDDPVPGLTCAMLEGPVASYPPNASARSIELVNRYRSFAPLTCVTASTVWHDLDLDLRR